MIVSLFSAFLHLSIRKQRIPSALSGVRRLDECLNDWLHLFLGVDRAGGKSLAGLPVTRLHYTSMNRARIEKISRALADQTRLRIFEAISATGHMNCGEIVSMRGVTPATVSHHLKVLQEAGLIQCQREGQFVYSRSVPAVIMDYTRALAKMTRRNKTSRSH